MNEIYDGSDDGGAARSYAYFFLLFSRLYFPFTSAKIEIFFYYFSPRINWKLLHHHHRHRRTCVGDGDVH